MSRKLTPMDRLVRLAQAYRAAATGADAERALAELCGHFTESVASAERRHAPAQTDSAQDRAA
jgi:hypothetical protein